VAAIASFAPSMCAKSAGLTEDVALALGIIVRCLGDSETVHTSRYVKSGNGEQNTVETPRLTENDAGILGPGHIGRMLNLANQCGNLRATTTLGQLQYLFYSINRFYFLKRRTTPLPEPKPHGGRNFRTTKTRDLFHSIPFLSPGRQLPSAGSPR